VGNIYTPARKIKMVESEGDQVTLDLEQIEEKEDAKPTLGDIFTDRVESLMKHRDIDSVLDDQHHMYDPILSVSRVSLVLPPNRLNNLEMMNEKLKFLNMISQSRYEASVTAFRFHMRLLSGVKKDLDSVFRRIRTLKTKLGAHYPEIMAEVQDKYTVHVSDDDDDV